jgi:hypothetical protein
MASQSSWGVDGRLGGLCMRPRERRLPRSDERLRCSCTRSTQNTRAPRITLVIADATRCSPEHARCTPRRGRTTSLNGPCPFRPTDDTEDGIVCVANPADPGGGEHFFFEKPAEPSVETCTLKLSTAIARGPCVCRNCSRRNSLYLTRTPSARGARRARTRVDGRYGTVRRVDAPRLAPRQGRTPT